MSTTEIGKNVLTELLGHSLKTIAGSLETSPTHQTRGIRILDKYANARCIELLHEVLEQVEVFNDGESVVYASDIEKIADKYTNHPE